MADFFLASPLTAEGIFVKPQGNAILLTTCQPNSVLCQCYRLVCSAPLSWLPALLWLRHEHAGPPSEVVSATSLPLMDLYGFAGLLPSIN